MATLAGGRRRADPRRRRGLLLRPPDQRDDEERAAVRTRRTPIASWPRRMHRSGASGRSSRRGTTTPSGPGWPTHERAGCPASPASPAAGSPTGRPSKPRSPRSGRTGSWMASPTRSRCSRARRTGAAGWTCSAPACAPPDHPQRRAREPPEERPPRGGHRPSRAAPGRVHSCSAQSVPHRKLHGPSRMPVGWAVALTGEMVMRQGTASVTSRPPCCAIAPQDREGRLPQCRTGGGGPPTRQGMRATSGGCGGRRGEAASAGSPSEGGVRRPSAAARKLRGRTGRRAGARAAERIWPPCPSRSDRRVP